MALATGGLLLLLGGLLVRGGAGAEPCRAPGQWEGRSVRYDHGTGRNTRAAVSYDGLNQRLRILEERKALIPCKNLVASSFLPECHTSCVILHLLGETEQEIYILVPLKPLTRIGAQLGWREGMRLLACMCQSCP